MLRYILLILSLLVVSACYDEEGSTTPTDTQTPIDTAQADTGAPDTGTPDTSRPDTGSPDTGSPDTGTPDTGSSDTGSPDTGAPDTSPTPETLTLMTLNLHCFKLEDTAYTTHAERWAAIADLVQSEGVDVLLAQEVCDNTEHGKAVEQLAAALDTATGHTWSHTWQYAHLAWENTPDEADEGLAILTRFTLGTPRAHTYITQGGLQRIELAAEITHTSLDASLTVASLHLDFQDDAVRLQQARDSANGLLVHAPNLNVIAAGDFNANATSNTLTAMTDWGYLNLGASLPPSRIDHITLHRGAAWAPIRARMAFDGSAEPEISDHPAVLVELQPQSPESLTLTPLTAIADVGFGNHLTVRGDTPPLDWNATGWPLRSTASDTWELVHTEWTTGPIEVKLLRNDSDWETGDNLTLTPGQTTTHTPIF